MYIKDGTGAKAGDGPNFLRKIESEPVSELSSKRPTPSYVSKKNKQKESK